MCSGQKFPISIEMHLNWLTGDLQTHKASGILRGALVQPLLLRQMLTLKLNAVTLGVVHILVVYRGGEVHLDDLRLLCQGGDWKKAALILCQARRGR
jgi:hypothetical protein